MSRYCGAAAENVKEELKRPDIHCWTETNHETEDDFRFMMEEGALVEHVARPRFVKGGGIIVRVAPWLKDKVNITKVGTWRITVEVLLDKRTESTFDFST